MPSHKGQAIQLLPNYSIMQSRSQLLQTLLALLYPRFRMAPQFRHIQNPCSLPYSQQNSHRHPTDSSIGFRPSHAWHRRACAGLSSVQVGQDHVPSACRYVFSDGGFGSGAVGLEPCERSLPVRVFGDAALWIFAAFWGLVVRFASVVAARASV